MAMIMDIKTQYVIHLTVMVMDMIQVVHQVLLIHSVMDIAMGTVSDGMAMAMIIVRPSSMV